MKALVITLLFLLLFVSQLNTILDVDLWWNLKTGEVILRNLEIPHTDIFSYTLENKTWIDHEWLSQVLFYLLFSKFGWLGLNIFKAFIVSLSFLVLFYLIYSKYKKIIFAVFFMLLSVLAFGYRSFVRPEIFSYLFLCIYIYILEKEKRMNILPFLQIIWVNLHGYFILGPVLVFLYTAGEFFSGHKDKAKRLAALFIGVALACFVSPYFYKGALYPLWILRNIFSGQNLWMQNVHELMMPIRASFFKYVFFWLLAISASISFILNLKNVRIKHLLIFALSFLASYMAVRNMPIFIFAGMCFASINLNESFLKSKLTERRYYAVFILIISALTYLFLSNRYYLFTNQLGLRKTESKFSRLFMPSGACDFLERNRINGVMFNTLDFGPYIGYRFYPEKRIFIDTRTDLYKDDFYRLYRNAQNYPGEWHRLCERYGFEIVLLRHFFGGTEKISRYLYSHEGWRLVYYDEISCVFLSNTPRNAGFIDRFEIDLEKKDLLDSDININVAGFFEKIGEDSLAEKIYIKLLKKNPTSLRAGNSLATIYINSGRISEGLELIERFLDYHPKSSELYSNMGIAYLSMGKKEEGLSMLKKSLKLDPYLRKASYMLGTVYLERGQRDKAMDQFIKYSKLDPYDAQVHRILGDIYREKGLLKKAEAEYNEAGALDGV